MPSRVVAALEVESGLNDPMSVRLAVGRVELLTAPDKVGAAATARLLGEEMAGGAAICSGCS